MPGKKPHKPPEHEHDDIAYRNLKDIFGNWNIERGGAEKSGIEYGKDWRVEIVRDNGEVTGFEFWVQSKVLYGKKALIANAIGDLIKVTTLNYLYDLAIPALLHFYHKPTKTAYVMWLKPWYVEVRQRISTPQWEKTQKIRVNIPRTNVLNSEAVKKIQADVGLFYFRQGIENTANIINETSKDYLIERKYLGNHAIVVVNAKHEGAIPTLTPLDEEAARSIEHATQIGLPTPISGKVSMTNVPELLIGEHGLVSLTIFPNFANTPRFPLRIQFLAETGEPLHQDYVHEMEPVQDGTHVKSWRGKAHNSFLVYELKIIIIPERKNVFHFEYDISQTSPLILDRYYRLMDELARAKRIRLLDPRDDRVVGEEAFDVARHFTAGSSEIKRIAKALAVIATKVGILIDMPKEFDDDDLLMAEAIARVLETGRDEQLIGLPEDDLVLILDVDVALAQKLVEEQSEENVFSNPASESIQATVLGQTFDLGSSEHVFVDVHPISREDISKAIQDAILKKDDTVHIVCSFDRERSYTILPKWNKDND